MLFGFFPLIRTFVLLLNAIAILSEDRFLGRIGWAGAGNNVGFQQGYETSVKAKMINLISATRLISRMPLIGLNSVIIMYELLFG